MNLDTLVHDALNKFKEVDSDPTLCNSALEQLEIMFILPDADQQVTLREFKYTAPPVESEWDFPSWQLPVHFKFLKVYTNRWLDVMIKINTLNYLIKLYAFLQVHCSDWSHDTGGECNSLVADYIRLACRDIEQVARDNFIDFSSWPTIGIRTESRKICFTEMIGADISRNERERQAKAKGFESHKDFWRYQLDQLKKEFSLESDKKE